MRSDRVPILALFVCATTVSTAVAENSIVVAAQDSEAMVAPRPVHARVVSLPPLTFNLRAAIRCAGEPVSVTLSVADTFVTKGRDELDGQRATEASLTVPAQQLAMAPERHFCTEDEDESGNELYAPGFATAHASLQCEGDTGVSVVYASTPLNVKLGCTRLPDEDDSEIDQDPSSDAR
jgi:hypothetical protein